MNEATAHLSKKIDFEGLPLEQQRMLIATDALAQLHAGRLKPRCGKYVNGDISTDLVNRGGATLAEAIESAEGGCEVCALGSIFAAAVVRTRSPISLHEFRSGNDIVFMTQLDSPEDRRTFQIGDHILRRELAEYFSTEQLGLMESAFECERVHYNRAVGTEISPPEVEEALAFGYRYGSARDRLEAILQNVIDHCGVFTP